MLRFVAVLSLVAVARAGAPVAYGAPAYAQAYASAPAYAQAYAPAPAFASYAAPAVTAVRAHAVATPVRAYAPAVHAVHAVQPQLAHAPVAHYAPAFQAVHAAPVAKVAVRAEPFDPHPQYNFGYSVADSLTGDQHSHHESRDGDVVKGQYSLVEPDGAIRTVTYTSDAVNGFNAVVDRQAPAVAVQKTLVQKTLVQPQFAHAPVAHYAPAVQAVHASPTLSYAHPAGLRYASPVAAPALSYAQPAVQAIHAQPAYAYQG